VHVHDALIIGAGPAGAAAATFLKEAAPGLDVLLLDRNTFPRDKTCGDGLTPRALRVLDDLRLLPEVARLGCSVDAYEVVAPNGRVTRAPITASPGATVLPRLILDDLLLRRALASGAQFEADVAVSRLEPTAAGVRATTDQGHTFDGRLALVATGAAFGLLTRSGILSRPPKAMLATRTYFEDLQHDVARSFQLRFDDVPQPGYGWIFPVADRAANVGVGFLPHRRSGLPTAAFDRFVAGPAVARILQGGRQAGPVKGYPIRVDFLSAPTYASNTLLLGEAAGLVNPLTGEGIDYALESAHIAADVAGSRLTSTQPLALSEYHARLHARFDRIFRFSEWIRDWYCKPPILNALVPLANRRPELRSLLANIVLGEREPRGYGPLSTLVRLLTYLATTRPPRSSE
jgi:geranylgeranyl reductase family protein